MPYRYETHMHTAEGSGCASATGAEMARAHKEKGWSGIFVTDHFFNGNTAVPRELPWQERVELFCKGYENALEEGKKIGIDVFFGFEYCYQAADFLVYNLDKQWLLGHEDIDRWPPREAFAQMREDGGFIVHAHPFRERNYINHIHLFPRDVDGVEAVNGGQIQYPEMNERAALYAKMYDLPVTAGSDSHHLSGLFGSGIETEEPIREPLDYLRLMREGKLKLLAEENPWELEVARLEKASYNNL